MSDEQCPNIERCPMFPLFRHEGTLAVWKINYCETPGCARCERWQRFCRNERPPDGMLPNGKLLTPLDAPGE